MATKRYIVLFLFVLMICLFLQGCSRLNKTDVIPTSTPTFSPSIPPAFTSTPYTTVSSTFSPVSTLDPQSSDVKIRSLMQTNGDCNGFCFWGVKSGETSFKDAYAFFSEFIYLPLIIGDNNHSEFTNTVTNTQGRIYISFDITAENEYAAIKSITIDGIGRSDVSSKEWSAFRIDNYLITNGIPDDFIILMSEGQEGRVSYTLILKYNQWYVEYNGKPEAIKPAKILACPKAEQSYDRLEILSSEFGKEFLDLRYSLTQSELTGMSNEDLYKTLTDKSNEFCLNLDYEKYYKLVYEK